MNGRFVRGDALDALESDGEALLLLPPDRVVRLSPIATMIFNSASSAVSLEDLAPVVEERFGPPAGRAIAEAVSEIVDGLVAVGALELAPDV
ncbi:hypothetical protein FHX52_1947 [Humibacillus xanthopallidus]|uniref:Coenzyme PQQ synthesis protein D (PqqD) n=1 Tax=Humibacillus xanthopallidus TaxID=412689 RepID=A0A543PXM3_9MICO|nr:hypothetical protein [Humibacillus xanthopallidus]TQN48800.1 hypothetical protein FHX52_1947 [Humibacillus xanthopallidus]